MSKTVCAPEELIVNEKREKETGTQTIIKLQLVDKDSGEYCREWLGKAAWSRRCPRRDCLRARPERTASAVHKEFHVTGTSGPGKSTSQSPGGEGDWWGGACVGQFGELIELYPEGRMVKFLNDFSRGQIYQGQIYISHSTL